MSYILEALKKSEQERRRTHVPDLQTVHQARPAAPEENRVWPYVVIVLLLVSLAFVIGWMQPWRRSSDVLAPAVPEPSDVAQPVEVQASVASLPVVESSPGSVSMHSEYTPTEQSAPAAEQVSVYDTEPVNEPPSLDIPSVPHLSEMPQLVQQAIPEMSFAGHVYSSNARQRSVIINGRTMGEGDALITNLVVEQITRDGVIFKYQDQLFRVEILQDWSFD